MGLLKEFAESASLAAARMTDETIRKAMPEGAVLADMSCTILGGGTEVYSCNGVPFLELHPLKFEIEGGTLRLSRKWRAL